jgi:hypothetical protein
MGDKLLEKKKQILTLLAELETNVSDIYQMETEW